MNKNHKTVLKFTLRGWVNIFLYKTLYNIKRDLLFLFADILPVLLARSRYWLCIRDHGSVV